MFFLHEDDSTTFSPAMNVSWYEAKKICASYNGTLPSFSSHKDIITIQAFLMENLHDSIQRPVFVGLRKKFQVSISYVVTITSHYRVKMYIIPL